MGNPLLDTDDLPAFSKIRPEHIEPAVDQLITENSAELDRLLAQPQDKGWDELLGPLEAMNDRLERAWSPVRHLNAVVNSEPLRAAYNVCLPKLTEYWTGQGQNEALARACHSMANGPERSRLNPAQRKVLENKLRDFRLAGVDLVEAEKQRFKAITRELSELQSKFSDNVLDSTNAWGKHIDNEHDLTGLPETALALARRNAEKDGLSGWVLNLEAPCYLAVMAYADDRELRREVYEAYATRASTLGPHDPRYDNAPLIERILELRHEAARLLGFQSYAQRSLATKMAKTTSEVIDFLTDLGFRARPQAQRELAELIEFACAVGGPVKLEAWDITYYGEKMRQERFGLSQETLRPYFPMNRVIPGLFGVIERLYGVRVELLSGIDTWHPDVSVYGISNNNGDLLGLFYLDLFARPNKRGGAWMDECRIRRRTASGVQKPVAYVVCNLMPPLNDQPALFTHDEVTTIFHEFGHALHHLLTQVDYAEVSGINGVEWDAVELPSQIMENWCWEKSALDMISGHYQTGAPLPEALFDRLLGSRHFQAAMRMVRQLEFSLFDFRIHQDYDPVLGGRVNEVWQAVRDQVAVVELPSYHRFPNSFSHVFSGGYAAGYYSYMWAEVLSADAFSKFEENGIFDRATGEEFLRCVLEVGGTRDAMESFVAFRGSEPNIEPLLRHSGIGG